MAVTIAISFLLVIPIEPSSGSSRCPSGLLIGYYANQRSNRRAGPWHRILGERAVRRPRHRPDRRRRSCSCVKALFFFADNGYRDASAGRADRAARSGADCVYQRYLLDRGRESGVTRPASPTRPRSRGSTGRAVRDAPGSIVVLTCVGGLGGALLYGVFRRSPTEGTAAPAPRTRLSRHSPPPDMQTPRAVPGASVDAAGPSCSAVSPCRRPSSWARPWSVALAVGLRGGGFALVSALAVDGLRVALVAVLAVGRRASLAGRRDRAAVAAAALAAAASARAVLLSAARALPAAVWAPLALSALPAAIRALAAFAAAALPVVLTTRPPVWTAVPPSAALTLRVRRDLRRAAAFGWMAPSLGGAIERAQGLEQGGSASIGARPGRRPTLRAFATNVFAAVRRGLRTSWRRCGLTDALETRRRASARPGAGRLGQVGEPRAGWMCWIGGHRGADRRRARRRMVAQDPPPGTTRTAARATGPRAATLTP